MRSSNTALLVAVLALGALVGCGQPRHESDPAPVNSAPAHLGADTVDMITRSGDYPERYHRVDVADVESIRRCMRAAGFAWAGVAGTVNPEAKEGGGVSLDVVREHGYGLSDGPEKPEKIGSGVDDTALRAALFGAADDTAEMRSPNGPLYTFSRHGCAAQGHIAIYGDLDTWARISYLPQEYNLRLSTEAKADPRYETKLREWRACMAGKHYSYASPDDIVEKLIESYRTDHRPLAQRRAAEITIALQDVSCDKQVRMSATALTLRREYAQRLPAADRAELARLSALFRDAERRGASAPLA